jgi:hypothetical protein
MPFTSMVTATLDGVGPQGGVPNVGSRSESTADGAKSRDEDDAETGSSPETRTSREAELAATVAVLEADRDRLLAERRELRKRYEQLLREEQRRPPESTPPADDGLLLRLARRLGLR